MDIFKQPNMLHNEMRVSSALKMRKVHLNDEVNDESIFEATYLLDKIIEIDKKTNTKEPVELIIKSPGGSIYDGLSLLGKIKSMQNDGYEIITTASGLCASMAFIILIAGSKRRAYEYATIMVHTPSSCTWGFLKDMQEDVEETDRLWEVLKTIIVRKSHITEYKLDEIYKCKQDWYMDVDNALELGVIDEIL